MLAWSSISLLMLQLLLQRALGALGRCMALLCCREPLVTLRCPLHWLHITLLRLRIGCDGLQAHHWRQASSTSHQSMLCPMAPLVSRWHCRGLCCLLCVLVLLPELSCMPVLQVSLLYEPFYMSHPEAHERMEHSGTSTPRSAPQVGQAFGSTSTCALVVPIAA